MAARSRALDTAVVNDDDSALHPNVARRKVRNEQAAVRTSGGATAARRDIGQRDIGQRRVSRSGIAWRVISRRHPRNDRGPELFSLALSVIACATATDDRPTSAFQPNEMSRRAAEIAFVALGVVSAELLQTFVKHAPHTNSELGGLYTLLFEQAPTRQPPPPACGCHDCETRKHARSAALRLLFENDPGSLSGDLLARTCRINDVAVAQTGDKFSV